MKVALAAGIIAASLAHTAGIAPARVQVVAREYSFSLSRLHLHAGTALIELANFGQDPHDLRVQRIGGTSPVSGSSRRGGARRCR